MGEFRFYRGDVYLRFNGESFIRYKAEYIRWNRGGELQPLLEWVIAKLSGYRMHKWQFDDHMRRLRSSRN